MSIDALQPTTLRRALNAWETMAPKHKNTALFGINLATTVLKVMVFDNAYQAEGYSDRDRQLLVHTEWVRQLLSAGLWLATSMGGLVLSQRVFPKANAMEHLLLGNLAAQISDTVIRPILTAKIGKRFIPKLHAETPRPPVSRAVSWPHVSSWLGFATQFQPQGYGTNPFAQTAQLFTPVQF